MLTQFGIDTRYPKFTLRAALGLLLAMWLLGLAGGPALAQGGPAVTETNGAISDVWQNSVSSPSFTWASGGMEWDVYWGIDPSGSQVLTTTTDGLYGPGETGEGTYYLRLRPRDQDGPVSEWVTAFIFKRDIFPPFNPFVVTEGHGIISDKWQADISTPTFSWIAGIDWHSGIASYDVYWGTDAAGETVTANVTGQSYAPGAVSSGVPYYLRLRTRDTAGNVAGWRAAFTFKYELPPANPTSVTETNGAISDVWQRTVYAPAFTWDGGSEATAWDVYWGSDPDGTSVTTNVTTAAYSPGQVSSGVYYLRMRARNGNDLAAAWTTAFTFKLDNYKPDQINRSEVTEGSGVADGVWQATTGDASFAWPAPADAHSGVAKYLVYWGTNPFGFTVSDIVTSPTYDPAAIDSGTYYLRLSTRDAAGNSSNWQTLFEFKYDGTAPSVTLDTPEFYPATLPFELSWFVTDTESDPANCTVRIWRDDGAESIPVYDQPYPATQNFSHFEITPGLTALFQASCANVAGLPSQIDSDADGLPDQWEIAWNLNAFDPADANGDRDSDNLTNRQEFQYGTNPTHVDTDRDGIDDWNERIGRRVWYGDISLTDWDTDGDGISDGEDGWPLDPARPYDVTVDTDRDGLPDGWESHYGLDPAVGGDGPKDLDGDWLSSWQEFRSRTNPLVRDTDGDGISDHNETVVTNQMTDPTKWDTDGDRYSDGVEFLAGSDPLNRLSVPEPKKKPEPTPVYTTFLPVIIR
jgi:hypothetical protein